MDLEQLQKRIQWIEDERRKEKDIYSLLDNRLVALDGALAGNSQQIKELSSEVTRLSAVVGRMDQFDQSLAQLRLEVKRQLDEFSKEGKGRVDEADKVRRVELKSLENGLAEMRKQMDGYEKLEKGLQLRVEEDNYLRRSLEELRLKLVDVRSGEEEFNRTYRLLDDNRRQDAKRIVDIQGELAALRKRADDQRGQSEVLGNSVRKLETRLNELSVVEGERREAMVSFLDKQALTTVERERVWKDWTTRFDTISKQAADVEALLLNLDTTNRDVRRSHTTLEELTQRVERRISELTEIQRLSEDRFRQEWVTFKADDQKRWTNYSLSQEEQRGELLRKFEKLSEQGTHLEDELQEVQDMLQQSNEQVEKRLQSLLAIAHEWVTSFERTVGRSR